MTKLQFFKGNSMGKPQKITALKEGKPTTVTYAPIPYPTKRDQKSSQSNHSRLERLTITANNSLIFLKRTI
jgi:hypothetical protein